MFKVKVFFNGSINEYVAHEGKNLLKLLRENGINIDSPCNGNGTCGKCRVKVNSEYKLSCNYCIASDIDVYIETNDRASRIITESMRRDISLHPIVLKTYVDLDKPGLSDQRADYERVLGKSTVSNVNIKLIREIPSIVRQDNYNITLITSDSGLLAVEPGDTTHSFYGVAIDIGTTTIAAYLINLSTGERIGVNSQLNPQKTYGADVISRIKHTIDDKSGLDELNKLIIDAVNSSIAALSKRADIDKSAIYAVTFAGNTTMLHLLLKVSPEHIASAPFIPVFTSAVSLNAQELGIEVNEAGIACVLPAVSAYIGADTAAAVLSTGMAEQESISLLIDIGTNGEIVLGNKDKLYACSAAAGPAFEGASIRNGIGSVNGAISSISLMQGVRITTIGDAKPVGICGTGIVDALAQMLQVGIIDETGRIDVAWKPDTPAQAAVAKRITTAGGMNAFELCKSAETACNSDIAVTQKDIREVQNAKAAIAAGIHVLVKQAGISFHDIKNVYLAGGFGSYINIESALRIGIIPKELEGKITAVGNAAGEGAVEALINSGCMAFTKEISKRIEYIELSGNKDFNDFYVDCMVFE